MPLRTMSLVLLSALLLTGCGGDAGDTEDTAASPADAGPPALTAFEMEHGIGPVTEPVTLGALDEELAEEGEELFEGRCSACHKMDESYVGPALGDVTQRRTAAFVMNMILNPEGMYTRHPEIRALLAKHPTQMPNQQLTREQARAVVEYLRTQAGS